jgi:flagellar motor switch/type III secretory pathway protein FliN
MTALTPEIVGDVVAACRKGADEIVASLTRALDGQFVGVTIGEAATYDAQQPPAGFDGPGLAVVLTIGGTGAVAVLPESSGLLPAWYRQPDATGKSKLSTLAQELSLLLVPASVVAEGYHAAPIDKLADALARAEVATGAALVPVALKSGDKQGQLSFLWPATKPGELAPTVEPVAAGQSGGPAARPGGARDELARLPKYTRSFLKVKVPVSVNLASQKLAVKDIRELVPGAIIKFDKSCEEMLDLTVCDQTIAAGEVVKVGDKFGLRIRHMTLPQEQFIAVKMTMAS